MRKYRVLNPRKIQKGVPILGYKDLKWYEGDVFVPPVGMDILWLLSRGLIEVV